MIYITTLWIFVYISTFSCLEFLSVYFTYPVERSLFPVECYEFRTLFWRVVDSDFGLLYFIMETSRLFFIERGILTYRFNIKFLLYMVVHTPHGCIYITFRVFLSSPSFPILSIDFLLPTLKGFKLILFFCNLWGLRVVWCPSFFF